MKRSSVRLAITVFAALLLGGGGYYATLSARPCCES
jgi:hypothetical protein